MLEILVAAAALVGAGWGLIKLGQGTKAGLSSASMSGPNTIKAGEWGTWTLTFTTAPSKVPLIGATEGSYDIEINWDPAITDPTSGPAFDSGKWRNVTTGTHNSRINWDANGPVKIEWKITINGLLMGQGTFAVSVTN
jgi:hypothetical protein